MQKAVYEHVHSRGAKAIIPLNRRGEKEPPAGLDANRNPGCSMGYPIVLLAGTLALNRNQSKSVA